MKVTVKKETAQFHLKDVSTEEWKKVGPQKNMCILSGGFTGNFIGIAVHDLNKKEEVMLILSFSSMMEKIICNLIL